MNKNIIITVLIIGVLVIGFFWYQGDSNYKADIEKLEKERETMIIEFAVLEYKNDSIKKLKRKVLWRTKETTDKLNKQQNETDAIPGIVATYTDRKLDSKLSNHRHKPRSKNRDSINP